MNWLKKYIKVILPSIMVAIFPIIFLYNHNARKLNIQSLLLPLGIMIVLTLCITAIALISNKASVVNATIASILFLISFYMYGNVYDNLVKIDILQIEHVTFLPIFIFIIYLIIMLFKKIFHPGENNLMLGLTILCGGLLLFNIISIVPIELQKIKTNQPYQVNQISSASDSNNIKRPDVYYIVFDESAGFNAIRDYWHYDEINNFENFLKSKGFFVAEDSKSNTRDTLIEIASRLNMTDMSGNANYTEQDWFEAISNNKVMQIFKQLGYTTVVIDQVHATFGYSNKTPIIADFDFTTNDASMNNSTLDEFDNLVFKRTMLGPLFDEIFKAFDTMIIQHRNNVIYFFDKIANLDDISSPKFVYGQVLLTHYPLIFDENGNILDDQYHANWNYYLGSYKYEISKATELINSILEKADPTNPPIIILQSDHGMRNNRDLPTTTQLTNYPEEYQHDIINALLIPGYDNSKLSNDLNPINTFPIIINYLFNENIPLQ